MSPCALSCVSPTGHHYGDAIPTACLLSFRLGGTDGVSVEAAKWQAALGKLGFGTVTVAGEGSADRLVPGLAMGATEPPVLRDLEDAFGDADVVIVENVCSLPLNPPAASIVADVLAGRPAVLHHHDLPWQRQRFIDHPPPPDDPRWVHVTINELSRRQLADRDIPAVTVYNSFATCRAPVGGPASTGAAGDMARGGAGDMARGGRSRRDLVRRALGIDSGYLVLQPTRAIPRKNVPGGIAATTELGGTYWLLGGAEDGYGPELDRLVAGAQCRVILGPPPDVPGFSVLDAYAACDVVALPSTWEGFGNPSVESAVHRLPLVIGPYPVAAELAAFGFDWFGLDEVRRLRSWWRDPDRALLDRNEQVADTFFSVRDLPDRLAAVLPEW